MDRASALGRALAGAASVSLVGLFVLPLAALFVYAGGTGLGVAAQDPGFRTALEFTLLASAAAVGSGLLVGVPLGYALARFKFPGRRLLESVVTVPVVVPHLVVGIGLLLLFAPSSPVGRFTESLGVTVFDATAGVVLVMVYVGAPYVVLTSQMAFRAVDDDVVEAARSLGATPTEALVTVTIPAAARGILTGALLMWARGVSEVGGFLILAFAVYPGPPWSGPPTSTASVWVYNYWGIDPTAAVGASALLVLVALALFLVVRLFDRTGFAGLAGRWFA